MNADSDNLFEGVRCSTNQARLKQKSRDFYWFSPILRQHLDDKCADLVVFPKNQAEIAKVVSRAVRDRTPITARGGGTGNYGQCVPLAGGIVIDFEDFNHIISIDGWRATVESGARIGAFQDVLRSEGKEMRLYPSTERLSSMGGFLGGGAGGVGTVSWGVLSQPGNVLGVTLMTIEEEPRVLSLRGHDLGKILHAYGTTGLLLDVEVPLVPAYSWVELLYDFAHFSDAMDFSRAVTEDNAIVKRDVASIQWDIPMSFRRLSPWIEEGRHIVLISVADISLEALDILAQTYGSRERYRKTAEDLERENLRPNFEYCWNHATLNYLTADRSVTYLQCGFPLGQEAVAVAALEAALGDEVRVQLQWVRLGTVVTCFGLHIVQYSSPARLQEVAQVHRDLGISLSNCHVSECEHGEASKPVHEEMADFKEQTDPFGLLNPGKLRSWSLRHPDVSNASHLLSPLFSL